MLRAARHAGVSRRFVMIHGVREPSDLAYDDELRGAGCTYIPLCTRADADWQGMRGRVQVALTRWHETTPELADLPLDPQHAHVLLCGNPAMIDEVRDLLVQRGYTLDTAKAPGTLHFERYW
jgi:ferredoxin--NADP+ reductase